MVNNSNRSQSCNSGRASKCWLPLCALGAYPGITVNIPQPTQSCIESVLTTSMSKQRGLLNFRCSSETSEFTKPPGSCEFCGFPFRKNQERASKFGSILGRDRGLVNNCSAAAGRAPNWTGRALNSSYCKVTTVKISQIIKPNT